MPRVMGTSLAEARPYDTADRQNNRNRIMRRTFQYLEQEPGT